MILPQFSPSVNIPKTEFRGCVVQGCVGQSTADTGIFSTAGQISGLIFQLVAMAPVTRFARPCTTDSRMSPAVYGDQCIHRVSV